MRIIIFGTGGVGMKAKEKLESQGDDIVAFADNDDTKWGKCIRDKVILKPDEILKSEYDAIAIGSYKGVDSIKKQLIQMGVSEEKIIVPIEPPNKIFVCTKDFTDKEL